MLFSLDIETKCALSCEKSCKHALAPKTSHITLIGIYWIDSDAACTPRFEYFRSIDDCCRFFYHYPGPIELVGQNLKWDFSQLRFHGWTVPSEWYAHDTQLMAAVSTEKVPDKYLWSYAALRKEKNKHLPKGKGHRPGTPTSLKVLAPFFLGVEPFWEDPTNHDSVPYLEKDCKYTYDLCQLFLKKLEAQKLLPFYLKRMMPWARMLLDAEYRGIEIDLDAVHKEAADAVFKASALKKELDLQWGPAYDAFTQYKIERTRQNYKDLKYSALCRLKNPTDERLNKLEQRYENLFVDAVEKLKPGLDLSSPTQLQWLFGDHFKLNIRYADDDDEAELEADGGDDRTTCKEVLQRLVAEGRSDIKLFLEWREQNKLSTSFYPSYISMNENGVLRTSLNPGGTRTGRLSSSRPNLQQVPGELHYLFKARPGHVLITRDLSTIEPRIAAYYTEDPLLCDIFLTNRDFHSINAKRMFGLDAPESEIKKVFPIERHIAKTAGLALLYGAGPKRIKRTARQMGFIWEDGHCLALYKNFKDAYPVAAAFKRALDADARKGNTIYTMFGRGHVYVDPDDVHMKAFNTLVQSTASDLMLEGSRRAQEEFKEKSIPCHPLLWVHDESVWEAPIEYLTQCEEIIERNLLSFTLSTSFGLIPLTCEGKSGDFWAK